MRTELQILLWYNNDSRHFHSPALGCCRFYTLSAESSVGQRSCIIMQTCNVFGVGER